MSDAPMPLEAYAELLAHLLARGSTPVVQVLGKRGVSAEAFSLAEKHWTEQFGQSLA